MHTANDPIRALHLEVAAWLKEGRTEEEITRLLVSRGYEPFYARTILDNLGKEQDQRRQFRHTLFYGMAIFVLGILLNIAVWYFAVSKGSYITYIFWGIPVTGLLFIARAFILFRR